MTFGRLQIVVPQGGFAVIIAAASRLVDGPWHPQLAGSFKRLVKIDEIKCGRLISEVPALADPCARGLALTDFLIHPGQGREGFELTADGCQRSLVGQLHFAEGLEYLPPNGEQDALLLRRCCQSFLGFVVELSGSL